MTHRPFYRRAALVTLVLLAAAAPAAAQPKAKANKPKPDLADVKYGPHERNVLDLWKAKSEQPTPLVVFIHGGGFAAGSKEALAAPLLDALLSKGISVMAINYRLSPGVAFPAHYHDCGRAIQFARSKAREWNLDPKRVGATGGSAGAGTSLWLGFHDDLADPKSDDPVARESTRLLCAAVVGAQTSLDPQQMKEWMPNSRYGGHAFGFAPDAEKKLSQFDVFLAGREKILPWIKEYSPYELVTSDDPPVALYYGAPPAMGQDQKDPTHSANFGVGLKQKCDAVGVACQLVYPGASDVKYPNVADFLISKLKPAK